MHRRTNVSWGAKCKREVKDLMLYWWLGCVCVGRSMYNTGYTDVVKTRHGEDGWEMPNFISNSSFKESLFGRSDQEKVTNEKAFEALRISRLFGVTWLHRNMF